MQVVVNTLFRLFMCLAYALVYWLILLVCPVDGDILALPITEGYVSLSLDGQSIKSPMDTGSATSFALYGPFYEEMNGEGSCTKLYSGCYFCPPDNPCDDIYQRPRGEVKYGDKASYEYVEHEVTLTIGTAAIKNFRFALAITHNGVHEPPLSILGLSFGSSNTVLTELKKRRIIRNLLYSIDMTGYEPNMAGTLTLGVAKPAHGRSVTMSPRQIPGLHTRKTSVKVAAIRFFEQSELPAYSYDGRSYPTQHWPSIVDSGVSVIDLPSMHFDAINQKMVEMISLDSGSEGISGSSRIIWFDLESGYSVIRKVHVGYLPVIVYCVGSRADCIELRVEPKHYTGYCDGTECTLAIGRASSNRTFLCLGEPLFRAYTVGFDLVKGKLYFSTTTGPILQYRVGFMKSLLGRKKIR